MTIPVLLSHVAARWAVTQAPAHGWVPDESETDMIEHQPETYRKKPVTIQAVQLTHENGADVWEWADSKPHYAPDGTVDGLTVYTLEGRMFAGFGDWIIRGVAGEFYPCKPEIFHQTYEEVSEQPPARPAPWAAHPARLQQWDTWEDVPVCTHVHGAHGAVQYCKAADGTVSIKGVFIPEWREMPRTPERMDELAPFTPATGTAPHAAPRTHAKAGQR